MPPASARDGGREVATGPATATEAAGEPGTAATTTARRARVGASAPGPGERGAGGGRPAGPRGPGPLSGDGSWVPGQRGLEVSQGSEVGRAGMGSGLREEQIAPSPAPARGHEQAPGWGSARVSGRLGKGGRDFSFGRGKKVSVSAVV